MYNRISGALSSSLSPRCLPLYLPLCAPLCPPAASLLRCLEYPQADAASAHDAADGEATAVWGVSAHTDFELFSLLHEQQPGLCLQDPAGVWHQPAWRPPEAAGASSWILIVGDMLARLSNGYFAPTPHRVRATPASAVQPRRSLVFFNALDELEEVTPIPSAIGCRSCTGGERRHLRSPPPPLAATSACRRLRLPPPPLAATSHLSPLLSGSCCSRGALPRVPQAFADGGRLADSVRYPHMRSIRSRGLSYCNRSQ